MANLQQCPGYESIANSKGHMMKNPEGTLALQCDPPLLATYRVTIAGVPGPHTAFNGAWDCLYPYAVIRWNHAIDGANRIVLYAQEPGAWVVSAFSSDPFGVYAWYLLGVDICTPTGTYGIVASSAPVGSTCVVTVPP